MGPGGFVCPRAVGCRRARPLCVPVGGGPPASRPRREPLARRVVSKPGQAPPPPTGTAARPSGPSGALHTSGAGSLLSGSARWLEARPCPPVPPAPVASQRPRALRFLAVLLRVVTNVVNRRCFSCGFLIRCYKRRQSGGFFAENSGFGRRLTTFVTEVLGRAFKSLRFDDVCNVVRPLVARPSPATAHGHRSQALSIRWPGCLQPLSPLLAGICVGVKPASPLRARNGLIWCIFRVQW